MSTSTNVESNLADVDIMLLFLDLHILREHIEEGRARLAPGVQPLPPFQLNVEDLDDEIILVETEA